MIRHAVSRAQPVFLVGMMSSVERVLTQLKVLRLVPDERRLKTRIEAFTEAAKLINAGDVEVK